MENKLDTFNETLLQRTYFQSLGPYRGSTVTMARKKIKLNSRCHGHVHGGENFRQSIIRRVQNSRNFRGKLVSATALSRSHFFPFPFLLGDRKFSFTKKYQVKICLWSKRGLVLKQCDLNSQKDLSTKLRRKFTLIW